MKRTMIITMALALMLPLALAAQPGPDGGKACPDGPRFMGQGHGGPNCGPGERMGRQRGGGMMGLLAVADEIGLTDDQRGQLKQMHTDFQMERIDLEANLEKAQVTLRTLMHDQDAAELDVNRAIDGVSGFRADMQKMQYSHRKQMQTVLTAEQTDKLEELRKQRRADRPGDGAGHGRGFKGHGNRMGGGWGNP